MKVTAPRNANVQDQVHRSCFWISMYFCGDVFVLYLQSHIMLLFYAYLIFFHLFVLLIAFSGMSTWFTLLVHSNYYSMEWYSDLLRMNISVFLRVDNSVNESLIWRQSGWTSLGLPTSEFHCRWSPWEDIGIK